MKSNEIVIKGYWSEGNAPEFYGTTKIVLKKGDSFSLKDARYRLFARDFEDLDLTQNILATHNVNPNVVGNYMINYSVTDSHENTTTLSVPVTVSDAADVKPMIERTMYTLPSIDNVSVMGINRGHNNDRQMLGIFVKADSTVRIRKTAGNSNLTYTMLSNDSQKESSQTISSDWKEITFQNDYTPFIKTLYKHSGVVKVEIEWNSNDLGVKELNYYHEGDNEAEFFQKWIADTDSYAVVENAVITVLIPYADRNKIVNYFSKGVKSLQEFCIYWRKVIENYDKMLGLEYAPDNEMDQNINYKYFVKANAHGVGAAYYAWDHIGINNSSVSAIFEYNWGGLHEAGHGYQGKLGTGPLNIGEVSNNVFAHYVQIDKSIYKADGDWLGTLTNIEQSYNNVRLNGGNFMDLDVKGKLYFIINFLDSFEGKNTYTHIAKLYRQNIIAGKQLSTEDAWALAIYYKYGVSLADYFYSWGIKISDEARKIIKKGGYKNAFSMKDLVVNESTISTIKSDLGLNCNYKLITNEQLTAYNLKGNMKINVSIDNFNLINGKYIYLKNSNNTLAALQINSNVIEVPNLAVGIYELVVPEFTGYYKNNASSIIISNNQTTEFNLIYDYVFENTPFENDVKVQFQGYYYNDAAEIKLTKDTENNIIKLNLRYKGTTLFNGGLPADYEYAKIQVLNSSNTEIYNKVVGGNNEHFASTLLETLEVNVEIGYKLVLKYHNASAKLKFISSLNGDYRNNYEITNNTEGIFIITENGFKPENMSNEDFHTEYINRLKTYMDNFALNVSEEDLLDKSMYKEEKAIIVRGYEKMDDTDKTLYAELITKII